MMPEQLWQTTLNPATRTLRKLTVEDAAEVGAGGALSVFLCACRWLAGADCAAEQHWPTCSLSCALGCWGFRRGWLAEGRKRQWRRAGVKGFAMCAAHVQASHLFALLMGDKVSGASPGGSAHWSATVNHGSDSLPDQANMGPALPWPACTQPACVLRCTLSCSAPPPAARPAGCAAAGADRAARCAAQH